MARSLTELPEVTVGRRLRRFEGLAETSAATAAKPHAMSELLEAVASLPEHKSKNGSGRAAASLSRRFAVSQSTVYQIRKVLKHGSPALLDAFRQGEISPKTAYKRLRAEIEAAIEEAR
jgi:hypothetical protein